VEDLHVTRDVEAKALTVITHHVEIYLLWMHSLAGFEHEEAKANRNLPQCQRQSSWIKLRNRCIRSSLLLSDGTVTVGYSTMSIHRDRQRHIVYASMSVTLFGAIVIVERATTSVATYTSRILEQMHVNY